MSNYTWTVSSGGTIQSGQGTHQIEVEWTSAGSRSVSVNFTNPNGCSALNPTVLPVTVNAIPSSAGPVSGDQSVCEGSVQIEYSCAPISEADAYIWTLPEGAYISAGAGTNIISVDFPSGSVSGSVSVYGSNACGQGASSPALSVTVNPIPGTPVATAEDALLTSSAPEGNQWFFEGEAIEGATGQTYEAGQTGWYWTEVTLNGCLSDTSNHVYVLITGIEKHGNSTISVYPVPNDGRFTISVRNSGTAPYLVELVSPLGVTVFEQRQISGHGDLKIPVDIGISAGGIYLLILQNSEERIVRKILVD
jgi:hypothetical protein